MVTFKKLQAIEIIHRWTLVFRKRVWEECLTERIEGLHTLASQTTFSEAFHKSVDEYKKLKSQDILELDDASAIEVPGADVDDYVIEMHRKAVD